MAKKSSVVMARVSPEIKIKAEEIMTSLGIPASVVINALYHQIIYTKSVPFSLELPNNFPSIETMGEKEFDEMMESSIRQAENNEGTAFDVAFAEIKSEIKNGKI